MAKEKEFLTLIIEVKEKTRATIDGERRIVVTNKDSTLYYVPRSGGVDSIVIGGMHEAIRLNLYKSIKDKAPSFTLMLAKNDIKSRFTLYGETRYGVIPTGDYDIDFDNFCKHIIKIVESDFPSGMSKYKYTYINLVNTIDDDGETAPDCVVKLTTTTENAIIFKEAIFSGNLNDMIHELKNVNVESEEIVSKEVSLEERVTKLEQVVEKLLHKVSKLPE